MMEKHDKKNKIIFFCGIFEICLDKIRVLH